MLTPHFWQKNNQDLEPGLRIIWTGSKSDVHVPNTGVLLKSCPADHL